MKEKISKRTKMEKYPRFPMSLKEKGKVKEYIVSEGFLYCFKDYTDFNEIKDEEFHRLRKNFLHHASELADYINLHEREY